MRFFDMFSGIDGFHGGIITKEGPSSISLLKRKAMNISRVKR